MKPDLVTFATASATATSIEKTRVHNASQFAIYEEAIHNTAITQQLQYL
jgi:hypothetical protein